MTHFLLTNDDGISAPGLWAAARTLATLGSVLVVAPARDYSGYGPAHPPTRTLTYRPGGTNGHAMPNVTAYALTGTPATCAHVGLSGAFSRQPIDLVVSGINAGANLGHDVLYSGTVGAALTAQLLGIPAIAVSLDYGGAGIAHWDAAGWAIRQVLGLWERRLDPAPLVFNVNVPNLPANALAGTRMAHLAPEAFLTKYRFQHDSHDDHTITVIRSDAPRAGTADPDSDVGALARGYVAVTPLRPYPDLLHVSPWLEVETPASLPSPTYSAVAALSPA
jgi:5'-nucleotidase